MRRASRGHGISLGFGSVVVASLALGLGASAAVFGVLDAVFLRGLAVPDAPRFHQVAVRAEATPAITLHSYQRFLAFSHAPQTIDGALARTAASAIVRVAETDYRTRIDLVSGRYFDVLGVAPMLGRLLRDTDTQAADGLSCVVSETFWRTRLGGAPDAVGRSISLNGRPFTIVGVTPRGFHGIEQGRAFDVAIPLASAPLVTPVKNWEGDGLSWLAIVVKLRNGVEPSVASAELQAQLTAEGSPASASASASRTIPSLTVHLTPARQGLATLRDAYARPLLVLMILVALVFSISLVNLFSLFLAALMTRSRALAIRVALGASRMALLRMFVNEGLTLALLGGALAIGMLHLLLRNAQRLVPDGLAPLFRDVAVDGRLVAFTAALSLTVGLALSIASWLAANRFASVASLRGTVRLPAGIRLRRLLAGNQVALAAVLLMAALAFVHTLRNLRTVDVGFQSANLVLTTFDTKIAGYDAVRAERFYQMLLERARAVPQVQSASLARIAVLSGEMLSRDLRVPGAPVSPAAAVNHLWNRVSPTCFSTMGLPIVLGRAFDDRDVTGAPAVAIVSQKVAATYWPTQHPLGQHVLFGRDVEIVGVVGNSRYMGLREADPFVIYTPLWQAPVSELTLLVRAGNPLVAMTLQKAAREIDPAVPLVRTTTMAAQVEELLTTERALAVVSGSLGAIALLLCVLGVYGTLRYAAERRTREFGVRAALGATRGQIMWLVFREAALVVAVGGIIGGVLAVGLLKYVSSILYGIAPGDSSLAAGLLAALCVVALISGTAPAWRASNRPIDTVLRAE